MPSIIELQQKRAKNIQRLEALNERAKSEARDLTSTEQIQWDALEASVEELNEQIPQIELEERNRTLAASRGTVRGGLAKAMVDAGWDVRSNPTVEIPADSVYGPREFRAPTLPAVAGWDRLLGGIAPLGQDRRFLFGRLPQQRVDGESSISDFRVSARTLTGTVERALSAVSEKATLDNTILAIAEDLKVFAVVIPGVPAEVLESMDTLEALLRSEAEFQLAKSLDSHVLSQIVAASPPFGQTGTTLIDKIRNGVASMRATGASPSIAVLNPVDAAALDLSADAGGYVFATRDTGTASPIWGQEVVERIGGGTDPIYLIDPAMLGMLYLGPVKVLADPFTGLSTNTVRIRVEFKALFHVRQPEGARRVAAS